MGEQLSAREREVLRLVRLGLTNEEIAQRLGITLDGAKYHVSQILSKLGVSTREEAAAVVLAEWRSRGWWCWRGGVLRTDEDESVPVVAAATPIPWVDSTPGPTPSPSPFPSPNSEDLAVPACRAQDVKGEVTGGNGAGGWIFHILPSPMFPLSRAGSRAYRRRNSWTQAANRYRLAGKRIHASQALVQHAVTAWRCCCRTQGKRPSCPNTL